ncbi:MAG: PEGA domain-containing protein [Polyangiaceae bacterium]|nr:PEGA domain-containing protein [Polyangiaceae bacterium]
MTSLLRRLCLSLLVATTTVASVGTAYAQGKPAGSSDEASERFRAGVGFYKTRDYAAALVEFKRAYELAPNYRVLFNLGQTSQELNDYASALNAFEQYLAEGGKEVDAKRRAQVEGWIADLKKKVGTLSIETNVEGAEILVDDVSVGTTPLDKPVVVNAGRRKLSATATDHTPVQRMIDVAGQDEKTIKLELVPTNVKKDQPPPPPPPPPPPAEPEIPVAAWVVLGLTGAAGIATAVMGGLALSARSDLDDELAKFPGNRTAIEDAQSKTKSFAIGTDVAGALTIAGAAATGIIIGVALSGSGSADTEAEKTAVRLDVAPTGFVIQGGF